MSLQICDRIIILIITDDGIPYTVKADILFLLFLTQQFISLFHSQHIKRINVLICHYRLIIKIHPRCRNNRF